MSEKPCCCIDRGPDGRWYTTCDCENSTSLTSAVIWCTEHNQSKATTMLIESYDAMVCKLNALEAENAALKDYIETSRCEMCGTAYPIPLPPGPEGV